MQKIRTFLGKCRKKILRLLLGEELFSRLVSSQNADGIIGIMNTVNSLSCAFSENLKTQTAFFRNFTRQMLHERISKADCVHFLYLDQFTNDIVNFFQKNFLPGKHLMLCRRRPPHFFEDIPAASNVMEIVDYSDIDPLDLADKKLVFHSLHDRMMVDFLYENNALLKNSFWMIFGGDLYDSVDDDKALFVKRNMGNYMTSGPRPEEKDTFFKKFGEVSGKWHHLKGYIGLNTKLWDECYLKTVKKDYILIQINHSCSFENLEMLEILSKFRDEDMRIRCILSYGNRLDCKEAIKKKGYEIFGDKFEYFEQRLTQKEYFCRLAEVDVLVMNQNRQQGLHNSRAVFYFGKKIYIKSDICTFKQFRREGFCVFDTNIIPYLNFEEFCNAETIDQKNQKDRVKQIDDQAVTECWKKALVI
jgi:hypothetical protein